MSDGEKLIIIGLIMILLAVIMPPIILMSNNKVSNFDKYLKSDSCRIEKIIEGDEYFIYRHGHKLKAQGRDKTEYKCTDGNTYIR